MQEMVGGFARHEALWLRVASVSEPHVVQFPRLVSECEGCGSQSADRRGEKRGRGAAQVRISGHTRGLVGECARQTAQVDTCGTRSLLGANPRRACPQQRAENCAQKPARPRWQTVIGSKEWPLRAPRIWVVAEWPRPCRRNDGDRRRQWEQRAHPGSRRHVDVHHSVDALEKPIVNNRRRKTYGIKCVDVLERWGSGRRSSVQREIRTLRMPDDDDRSCRLRRSVCQVLGRPPLRIRRKIETKAGILRPPDRARIRPAEDHVGCPGLVDEGDGTELSERARCQPSDRIAHAQAPEARARTGGLQEGTIGVGC